MKHAHSLLAALSAAWLATAFPALSAGEGDTQVPMTQLDMTVAAAEDRDGSIAELGRRGVA